MAFLCLAPLYKTLHLLACLLIYLHTYLLTVPVEQTEEENYTTVEIGCRVSVINCLLCLYTVDLLTCKNELQLLVATEMRPIATDGVEWSV